MHQQYKSSRHSRSPQCDNRSHRRHHLFIRRLSNFNKRVKDFWEVLSSHRSVCPQLLLGTMPCISILFYHCVFVRKKGWKHLFSNNWYLSQVIANVLNWNNAGSFSCFFVFMLISCSKKSNTMRCVNVFFFVAQFLSLKPVILHYFCTGIGHWDVPGGEWASGLNTTAVVHCVQHR